MQFFVISDNIDTRMGMRLAGIEGVVVHSADEVMHALEQAAQDETIGIVLMTDKLVSLCRDEVMQFKLTRKRPLVVEIPDRHNNSNITDAIDRYVREAVGIKI